MPCHRGRARYLGLTRPQRQFLAVQQRCFFPSLFLSLHVVSRPAHAHESRCPRRPLDLRALPAYSRSTSEAFRPPARRCGLRDKQARPPGLPDATTGEGAAARAARVEDSQLTLAIPRTPWHRARRHCVRLSRAATIYYGTHLRHVLEPKEPRDPAWQAWDARVEGQGVAWMRPCPPSLTSATTHVAKTRPDERLDYFLARGRRGGEARLNHLQPCDASAPTKSDKIDLIKIPARPLRRGASWPRRAATGSRPCRGGASLWGDGLAFFMDRRFRLAQNQL